MHSADSFSHSCLVSVTARAYVPISCCGQGAALDCLINARNEADFTQTCRVELEGLLERRVQDFRMDARLRRTCKRESYRLCGLDDDYDDSDGGQCLQVCALGMRTVCPWLGKRWLCGGGGEQGHSITFG